MSIFTNRLLRFSQIVYFDFLGLYNIYVEIFLYTNRQDGYKINRFRSHLKHPQFALVYLIKHSFACFKYYFKNSSLIHEQNTKEIIAVKESLYVIKDT